MQQRLEKKPTVTRLNSISNESSTNDEIPKGFDNKMNTSNQRSSSIQTENWFNQL